MSAGSQRLPSQLWVLTGGRVGLFLLFGLSQAGEQQQEQEHFNDFHFNMDHSLTRQDNIYQSALMGLKSSLTCKQQRKDFAACRATSVGRSGDPGFCDTQAAYFLQCHHET